MKHFLPIPAIVMASCLVSCYDEIDTTKTDSKLVTFNTSGFEVSLEEFTRASLDDEKMTDLFVCDNGEVIAHQVKTDEDFGSPTVELSYGEHKLSFIATRSEFATISDGVLTSFHTLPTFGKLLTITIDKNTETQNLELDRLVYCLRYTVEDVIPNVSYRAEVSCDKYYNGLNVTDFSGCNPTKCSYGWSIGTNYAGQSGISFSLYGFCPTLNTEYNAEETYLEFSNNGENNDGSGYTKVANQNVPLKTNRVTNIHGNVFGKSNSAQVSLNSNWDDQVNIGL